MLKNNTIPFRRRRMIGAKKSPAPPVLGPTLVAATWNFADLWVQLQFDVAIDPTGMDASQIVVDDGVTIGNQFIWTCNGEITIVNPDTIRLGVQKTAPSAQSGVHLTATSANGIVSAEDAEPWSGVTDLELPFG